MKRTKLSVAILYCTVILPTALVAQDDTLATGRAAPVGAGEITEIVTLGEYIPDEKRSTAAVSNVLDAEAFQAAGDSNVAEGLKRVSGLNLSGGRFIYIRGLGERYSNSMLNGATLPSPEPIRRVVPLDLFPASIIDSVLVQKTFSAAFPAEFGGGTVQMRTKSVPDEDFFNISGSIGYSGATTFNDGLTYLGGGKDWMGVDDGTRDLPDLLKNAIAGDRELRRANAFLPGGFSSEELEAIGESLPNNYTARTEKIKPDSSISVNFGKQGYLGDDWHVGILSNLAYSNTWDTISVTRNNYSADGVFGEEQVLNTQDVGVFRSTEQSVDTNMFVTAGVEYQDAHSIKATLLQIRKMDDLAGNLVGFLNSESVDIDQTRLEWIERDLLSTQLEGSNIFYDLSELTLDWHYNESRAKRDAPDMRQYRYDYNPALDRFEFSTRGDGNTRMWSFLEDNNEDIGFSGKIYLNSDLGLTELKAGMARVRKDRDAAIRRFAFIAQGGISNDFDLLVNPRLDDVINADTINRRGFELKETTRNTDNYTASQELDAYYFEADMELGPQFRLLAGMRWEDSEQNVTTFGLFNPETTAIESNLKTKDSFPVVTGTWILDDYGMQVRLGYSETISRPDFRELSPSPFTHPVTGFDIIGNPNLIAGYLNNYDARWEWYFSADESFSIGLFYKEFETPIEQVVETSAANRRTFINAQEAENYGIEFDIFKYLDFINRDWANWFVATNLTLIESEVIIRPEDRGVLTNITRPLQGQADYIYNIQIGFDDSFRQRGALVFHITGEKIREVGVFGGPDIMDEAYGELDFNYTRYMGDHIELTLKAKNILNQKRETTQGGFDVNSYFEGRSGSLSLQYTF